MNIGIIRLSVLGGPSSDSTYNYQCIGLAKALGRLGHKVNVYRLVSREYKSENRSVTDKVTVYELPSKSIGTNGFLDTKSIDMSLDAVLIMSDVQLDAYRVIGWAKRRFKKVFAYIGTIESHSNKKHIRALMSVYVKLLLREYKRTSCLAKTPRIMEQLKALGINETRVLPVGLDTDLLNSGYNDTGITESAKQRNNPESALTQTSYKNSSKNEIKKSFGFSEDDEVILFIGRLTEEKDPLRMVELFRNVKNRHANAKLLMIGNGNLKNEVKARILDSDLQNSVIMIDSISNSDIWQAYIMSECFVNLNRKEIFGMSILEAIYYECPVIACHAPGPDYILGNNAAGLINDDEEILCLIDKCLMGQSINEKPLRQRVIDEFTWDSIAGSLEPILQFEK